ncbi:MAG: UDP-N-acetylmuramoyl-L-alanine--D-glutamate ligase [Candidatus Woykebacteria bacterium]
MNSLGANFEGKKVAILGLGVEGLSSLKFFAKTKAEISVRDQKEQKDFDPALLAQVKNYTQDYVFGANYLSNISGFDVIVRSPALRPDLPEILKATTSGARLTSNLKLFFDFCKGKIIGVTGTKGKGTTSTLIFEMLKKAGKKVFIGGNIGTAPLDFLEDVTEDSWVVLEISSFQLIDMQTSPYIAVVLMIASEHLDWHKSTEEYIKAKTSIVSHQTEQDFVVINVDHPISEGFAKLSKANKAFVSLFKEQNPGVYLKNEVVTRSFEGKVEEILPIKEVFLRGRHNLENITTAAAVSSLAGVSVQDIASVAREFKGLPHRLEFVREVSGVKYYDDSFSTTPETAIAAIRSFSEPLVIILGGSEKGSDYTDLGSVVRSAKNIKGVILIGETADKIESEITSISGFGGKIIKGPRTTQEIITTAKSLTQPGDIVLLSPACASFGLFVNYKDRGDQFKEVVNRI